MNMKTDSNQPAFSRAAFTINNTWEDCDRGAEGLTIRQYYAAQSMLGLRASKLTCSTSNPLGGAANME